VSTSVPGLNFVHRYVPTTGAGITLLLLHGTGGNENDLLDLGRALAPKAALLGPRGKVLERGMPRFFRRLAEGVFDQEDLAFRTDELAEFVASASVEYRFQPSSVVAIGYSNGANIAASMLLRHPSALAGAVLFHPMVPFEPQEPPRIKAPIFMSAGRQDPLVPPTLTERLAQLLVACGAEVTVHWEPGGHELVAGEVDAAQAWLQRHFPAGAA
jgi:predicted esterase